MALDVVDEPLLVLAHPEEVVLLLTEDWRPVVLRALAVHEFSLDVKALAADTVESVVGAEVDVPGVVDLLEDVAHHRFVGLVGGPDEGVIADPEFRPRVPEETADLV